MNKFNDLVGQKFKKWTVIEYIYMKKFQAHGYLLRCECGNNYSTQMRSRLLKGTHTNQCGSCKSIKHGMLKGDLYKNPPRTYKSWKAMKEVIKYLKERDIQICESWKSFDNFYKDMGEKPPRTRLTRIDQKGSFEKSNCYWKKINCKDRT